MAEVKDVIPLKGILTMDIYIAACIVSNCVYVLGFGQNADCHCLSVLRITKDEEHQFRIISPWISGLRLSFSNLSVSATSKLILLSGQQGQNLPVLSIYNANG